MTDKNLLRLVVAGLVFCAAVFVVVLVTGCADRDSPTALFSGEGATVAAGGKCNPHCPEALVGPTGYEPAEDAELLLFEHGDFEAIWNGCWQVQDTEGLPIEPDLLCRYDVIDDVEDRWGNTIGSCQIAVPLGLCQWYLELYDHEGELRGLWRPYRCDMARIAALPCES